MTMMMVLLEDDGDDGGGGDSTAYGIAYSLPYSITKLIA